MLIEDVSSVKICSKMWAPEMTNGMPQKKYGHRALDDIKESIEELRYYKAHLWKVPSVELGTKAEGETGGNSEITDKVKELSISDETGTVKRGIDDKQGGL